MHLCFLSNYGIIKYKYHVIVEFGGCKMAKAVKQNKAVSMEEALWKSADKLCGSVEPAEYKHVFLSLFIK